MSESIKILAEELRRKRTAVAQLQTDMGVYRQKIADMDQRASVLSREMSDIERAIRALGGDQHVVS